MERSSVTFPRRKLRRIDFKAINLRYCLQDLILYLIKIKFKKEEKVLIKINLNMERTILLKCIKM